MTTLAILTEARRLIAEKGWTQGANVRDADGCPTYVDDPAATCFCAMGAILAAAIGRGSLVNARGLVHHAIGSRPLVAFNDDPSRSREEVLAAFDRAIKLARTEEKKL